MAYADRPACRGRVGLLLQEGAELARDVDAGDLGGGPHRGVLNVRVALEDAHHGDGWVEVAVEDHGGGDEERDAAEEDRMLRLRGGEAEEEDHRAEELHNARLHGVFLRHRLLGFGGHAEEAADLESKDAADALGDDGGEDGCGVTAGEESLRRGGRVEGALPKARDGYREYEAAGGLDVAVLGAGRQDGEDEDEGTLRSVARETCESYATAAGG